MNRSTATRWLAGTHPRPPAPAYILEALSRRLGRPLPAVEAALHHRTGAPREFTARALLTGLAVHALRLEEMHLTRVLDTLAGSGTYTITNAYNLDGTPQRRTIPAMGGLA
ncbi:hypothetical protein ACWF94_13210, partial [Streptomyces sp. NPDC055078]